MPLHTVAGLFCACATRSIIAGDPSAIHVFMSYHRSRNVVGKMWQEGHTHNTCRAGKKTINVAALHSILGCFALGVLFFVATEMERQACFSTVGGTTVVRSLFAYVVWLAHNLRASIAKIPDDCIAAMSVGMLRLHLCDVATAAHAQCHICEGAWTRMVTSAARDGI